MKSLSNLLNLMLNAVTLAGVAFMTSCAQMDTDLEPCPTGLDVNFSYDYNIQRADMFNDHVGGMSLYVFDKDNHLVLQKDTANTPLAAPLKDKNFVWHIAQSELPVGRYRIVALANQKNYNETLATTGAKMRRTTLYPGDDITQLNVVLDRNEANHQQGYALVNNQNCPLDTLWATRHVDNEEAWVNIKPNQKTQHHISLIRDTKQLNITLRQTVDPADMHDEDYEVQVYDNNGRLLYNNDLDANDERLLYTPYAQWTTNLSTTTPTQRADNEDTNTGEAQLMRTAHYELMTNRLLLHKAAANNAHLVITHKATGNQVVNIDLPSILADGRRAYEFYNYSAQEYLDREYQFSLDFFLNGEKWQYVNVTIEALSWSYRVQYESL